MSDKAVAVAVLAVTAAAAAAAAVCDCCCCVTAAELSIVEMRTFVRKTLSREGLSGV